MDKIINKFKSAITRIQNSFSKKLSFDSIINNDNIYLYAGDVPYLPQYKKYIGLSIKQNNNNHIKHNIVNKHPLKDNSVDIYQSEDVFEHIEYEKLPNVINDIYRILKPNGVFRLSIPDYRCDLIDCRCIKDNEGIILFDPIGGGDFVNGKIVNGGHLWFPTYEIVKDLLNITNFKKIIYYHYYDENENPICNKIDYSIGFIKRTPDNDKRVQNPYRPMSIVVDCIK